MVQSLGPENHRDSPIDKVIDVFCAGPASSGAVCEETVELPQLQPVEFWTRLLLVGEEI